MQIIITRGSRARTQVLQFNRWQLAAISTLSGLALLLLAAVGYHWVFLTAVRAGWPIVSDVAMLDTRDEIARRDRYMRENLDAIAQKVGQIQARVVGLEVVSERVSSLAGVKTEDLPAPALGRAAGGGRGGPYVPLDRPTVEQLAGAIGNLDALADRQADLLTLTESKFFETRLQALAIPNRKPVDGPIGSGFGFRSDPFTGRAALHTGMDFPAEPGTAITAAAGGMVRDVSRHPQYGLQLEIDHGNGLSTRYAHTSRVVVREGDLIRRGQVVAHVGSSGRSTGSHLHFEVLVGGVPQDPAKFQLPGHGHGLSGGTLLAHTR